MPLLASRGMQAALARLRRTRGATLADVRPHLLLVALLGIAATVRALLASRVPTPWIFVDELVHSDLARSLQEEGRFLVRDRHVTVSFVYPALIAPAWEAGSMATTYALAKTINAVAMSLAAIPVYVWGRRFLSERGALVAAALTLCLPLFVLTGTLMTENAFLPLFLLALLAAAVALEQPTLARQALLVGAVALTVATRIQGLLLLPIMATAILVYSRRRLRAFWPVAAATAAAALAYLLLKVAEGRSLFALGVYAGVRRADYSAGDQARWLAYTAGELVLALGVVPLCALAVCLAAARRAEAAERAFLAVASAAVGWSLVLGALAGSWEPTGLKERYVVHAAPVAFLSLVLWVERGAPRPRWLARLVAAAAVTLVAALPLRTLFGEPSLPGNAFGLIPFFRLAEATGSVAAVRALLAAAAVAAAASFLLVPRRLAVLLPAGVGVFLLVSSIPVFTTYRGEARAALDRAEYGDDPSWVDERAGRDAKVVFLNTANFEIETLQGRIVEHFGPVWTAEFWNRSVRGVVSLGLQEPAPLPQETTTLDWATGKVVGLRTRFVLARPRFRVEGRSLGRRGDLELVRTQGPVRLRSVTEAVDADGWTAGYAAYSVWTRPGPVRVEVQAASGPAIVVLGTLAVRAGGGATVARQSRRVRIAAPGGVVEVTPPPPPFRIEVHVQGDRPRARIGFRLARP